MSVNIIQGEQPSVCRASIAQKVQEREDANLEKSVPLIKRE